MQTASCTDKTIQTTNGVARNDNDKKNQQIKHQETSRRELVDKSSTELCISASMHQVPGSGTSSQLWLLEVARQDWKLNIVRLKWVKTNNELVWAES